MAAAKMQCLNCNQRLADKDAIRVTGRESGRTWFVHRPSAPGPAGMCFRYAVYGAEVLDISEVVRTDLTNPKTKDKMLRASLSGDEARWLRSHPR